MKNTTTVCVKKKVKEEAQQVLSQQGISLAFAIDFVLRGIARGALEFTPVSFGEDGEAKSYELFNYNQQAMMDSDLIEGFYNMIMDTEPSEFLS
jgi:hypothetical protein